MLEGIQYINDFSKMNQLNVLYGRRGVGKTTFLIQLSLALASKDINSILIGIDKERDKKIERRLIGRTRSSFRSIKIIRFSSLNQLLNHLLELALVNKKDTVIILDDIFPIRFLAGKIWTRKITAQVGVLLSLLIDVLSVGYRVWISIPEHDKFPLPRRWQLFIELTNSFYRLFKKHRIRVLSAVEIKNIPDIGFRWSRNELNIEIKEKPLKHLLLSQRGFIPLDKKTR